VTVLAVGGVAAIAALVAVRTGDDVSVEAPAADPTTTISTAAPLPTCAAALAALPPGALPSPTTQTTPKEAAGDAAANPANAADAEKQAQADAANAAATGHKGVKGVGTIVSATDSTVTISATAADPSAPGELTATFAPGARYLDGATMLDARPPLNPGDTVFFGALEAPDGTYSLIYLQVHPAATDLHPGDTVDPSVKGAIEDESRFVKARAEVVSVQPGLLSIRPIDGLFAGQVVDAAIGPATMYVVGTQPCVEPELTAGTTVGVLLVKVADGTYSAQMVGLFQG
jgi:hypothetical protein